MTLLTPESAEQQLREIRRAMNRAKRLGATDAEKAHIDADYQLTSLVTVLGDNQSPETQRAIRRILRAYNRVTRYMA